LTERLHTFNAVFTKNLGGEPDRTVTAHISLTDAQMSAIFQTTENIRSFDYLYEFDGVPPHARFFDAVDSYRDTTSIVRDGGNVNYSIGLFIDRTQTDLTLRIAHITHSGDMA
jgi:hypothetical protein